MYYHAISDKGSVKQVNQDSVLIRKLKTEDGTACIIGCVCDGLGGLSAGEIASCTAASEYGTWFTAALPALVGNMDAVKASFLALSQEINAKIYSFGKENGFRIGTTVSGVLITGEIYLTFNVGDSRVYRASREAFEQLTKDNSFVQAEMDAGRMSEQEAESNGQNHILTRCLGGYATLEAVDYTQGRVRPGDTFMFCSDGARHVVTPEEYQRFFSGIRGKDDLKTKLPLVIQEIIRRGETDNISIGCIGI